MSALEDRLRRFAYEWHEAMNSPYAVNMMPLLLEAASDIRSLAAPSLEAENAELRELCKKLYRLADESYVPFKDVNQWMNEFDNAIRAMRELGIEVDDGAE